MNPISQLKKGLEYAGLLDTQLSLKRNELLISAGNTDTNLYLVLRGAVRVYTIEDAEEQTIRFGYKDSFIAALDAYITEKPTDFYIQALKQTRLCAIPKAALSAYMESDIERMKLWRTILEQLIYQQLARERDLLCNSPALRYARVLARSPQVFQEIPHKYIAAYLRMAPETLSRLKKS